jgi:hypothetical protein
MKTSFIAFIVSLVLSATDVLHVESFLVNKNPNQARALLHYPSSNTALTASDQTQNPYQRLSLEECLEEAAERFHAIVKHGYPGMKIPALDPLQIGTLKKEIENDHLDVTLTLNDAVINGLNSIKLASKPTVDFKTLKVSLDFDIEQLELVCDDYDREGTYRIIFKDRDISKMDRSLTVTMDGIHVKLTLDLDFSQDVSKPTLTVVEDASEFDIGKVSTELEGSFLFNAISPLLTNFVTSAIVKSIKAPVEGLLTTKLQEVCQAQEQNVKMLEGIYKTKMEQGRLKDKEGNELKPRFLSGFDGVGQLPVPMFWEMAGVPVDELDHITIEDVLKNGKTGDILLFQGVASGSKVIRRFTQSPFSHVALLVKEEDLFDGKLVLLHCWSSENYDLIQEKKLEGIQINDVEDFLREYKVEWLDGREEKAVACFRSINRELRSEEEEKKFSKNLIEFMKETNGIPYAKDMGMIELYIAGLVETDLKEKDGITYYCASYVADALMKYGIIDDLFWSQQYGPRDFSVKYETLPFIEDTTSYSTEFVVDLD